MKSTGIELMLYLKEIGIPFSIDNFNDRLTIQKAVYIAKNAGFDLGYNFSFYLRGPYSKELTKEYYEIEDSLENNDKSHEEYSFLWETKNNIDQFKGIFNEYNNKDCPVKKNNSKELWLESVASLIYYYKIKKNWEEAKKEVFELKPFLKEYLKPAEKAIKKYNIC